MKKAGTLILLLAVVLQLFCACQPVKPSNALAESGPHTMAQLKRALDNNTEKCPAWMELPSGAVFALWNYGKNELAGDHALAQVVVQIVDGNTQTKLVFMHDDNVETRIFYRGDWEQLDDFYFPSSFQYYTNPVNGEIDVLIAVGQNHQRGTSYQASTDDKDTPEDSIGTEPLCFRQKTWNEGYPLWFFAVPLDEIDRDYTLRYGNYVLTGDDILSQSWKIGDAPELVYGVVVDYGE